MLECSKVEFENLTQVNRMSFSLTEQEICLIKENSFTEIIGAPKVSIIVPAYNTENYLFKCLFSLIKQTLKEIEIIIVDDGSTDNTALVASEFAKYDSRIKIHTQQNLKQGAARNNGTKNAKGEYVGFVDSDDWVDEDYYEKLYQAALKHDADIALATNMRVGNGKSKKRLSITKEEVFTTLQSKFDVNCQWKNECPTNKIYRLSMLKENNVVWPEGVFCEDKLFTTQALYFANKVVTVPDIYYYYFRRPDSTVNKTSKEHMEQKITDRNNAKRAVIKFLKDKNADLRDGDFWAVLEEKRVFGITIYKKMESFKSTKTILLGFKIKETKFE